MLGAWRRLHEWMNQPCSGRVSSDSPVVSVSMTPPFFLALSDFSFLFFLFLCFVGMDLRRIGRELHLCLHHSHLH